MKVVIVLALLISVVISIPINCQDQGIQALDIDTSDYDLFEFDETETFQVSMNCQDEDVCVVDCSTFISGCHQKIFFADFMNQATTPSAKHDVALGYIRACVRRDYDDPTKKFWMRTELLYLVRKSQQTFNLKILTLDSGLKFGEILDKLIKSDVPVYTYLARTAEMMLTVERMCQEDE